MSKSVKTTSKHFDIPLCDLPSMVDAYFYGSDGDHVGWVEMYGNDKGRRAIDALFPAGYIAWKPMPEGSQFVHDEWRAFEINVLAEIERGRHKLPMDVTRGRTVKTSAQAAVLLAVGAQRAGCRVGYRTGGPGVPLNLIKPEQGQRFGQQ